MKINTYVFVVEWSGGSEYGGHILSKEFGVAQTSEKNAFKQLRTLVAGLGNASSVECVDIIEHPYRCPINNEFVCRWEKVDAQKCNHCTVPVIMENERQGKNLLRTCLDY